MAFDTGCIELIEIVDAELNVRFACFQDVVDDDQHTVRDRNCGLVASSASGDTIELGVEIRGPLPDARPSDLAHNPSQPNVASIRRPFHPLASALLVARAQAGP